MFGFFVFFCIFLFFFVFFCFFCLFGVLLSQLFKYLQLPIVFPVTIRVIQCANSLGYHFAPTNPVSFITWRPSRIDGLSGKINPEIAPDLIHMVVLPFVYYFFICFIQHRQSIEYLLLPLLPFHHSLEWNDSF